LKSLMREILDVEDLSEILTIVKLKGAKNYE
jgi:hypothetical protein